MKKQVLVLLSVLVLAVSSSAFAVQSQVNFGPFINCSVYNDQPVPIKIIRTNYQINGAFGPATQTLICAGNCIIPPGGQLLMSGPANNPNIHHATCQVDYQY